MSRLHANTNNDTEKPSSDREHISRQELNAIGIEAPKRMPKRPGFSLNRHATLETEPSIWTGKPNPSATILRATGQISLTILTVLSLRLLFNEWLGNLSEAMTLLLSALVLALLTHYSLQILWVFFGIRYRITSERLFIYQGIWARRIDEIEFVFVEDIFVKQSALQRFFHVGDIILLTQHQTKPRIRLRDVKKFYEIKEIVRDLYYHNRRHQDVLLSRSAL